MYLSVRDRPQGDRGTARAERRRPVGRVVLTLGMVSLLTDISSESVAAILPLYLTARGRACPRSPTGSSTGSTRASARWSGSVAAGLPTAPTTQVGGVLRLRRSRRGPGLPALRRRRSARSPAVVAADRIGKGIRTAPRDAMISSATPTEHLGRAFGVHRTLDTIGAALGPLIAFVVLVDDPRRLPHGDGGLARLRAGRGRAAGPARARTSGSARERDGPDAAAVPLARPRRPAADAGCWWSPGPWACSRSATASSTSRCWTAAASPPSGSRCCTSAPTSPTSRWPCRSGGWPTGSAGPGCWCSGTCALAGAYLCAAIPSGGIAATVGTLVLLGTFYAATDGVIAAVAGRLVPVQARDQRHRRRPDRGGRGPAGRHRRLRPALVRDRPQRRAARASRWSCWSSSGSSSARPPGSTGPADGRAADARRQRGAGMSQRARVVVVPRGRRGGRHRRHGVRRPRLPPLPGGQLPAARRRAGTDHGPARRPADRRSATPGSDSQYGTSPWSPLDDPGGPRAFTGVRLRPGGRHRRRRLAACAPSAGVVTTFERLELDAGLDGRRHRSPLPGHPEPHPAVRRRHAGRQHDVRDRPLLHAGRLLDRDRDPRGRRPRAAATSRSSSWSSTAATVAPERPQHLGRHVPATTAPSTPPSATGGRTYLVARRPGRRGR